jgi:hypothetical protein
MVLEGQVTFVQSNLSEVDTPFLPILKNNRIFLLLDGGRSDMGSIGRDIFNPSQR